jgi:hypothetical protein
LHRDACKLRSLRFKPQTNHFAYGIRNCTAVQACGLEDIRLKAMVYVIDFLWRRTCTGKKSLAEVQVTPRMRRNVHGKTNMLVLQLSSKSLLFIFASHDPFCMVPLYLVL